MANTASTPATQITKQVAVVRPRSINQIVFLYRNFSDLKNLVLFIGSRPMIDDEGNLWFRKIMIPDNSVILRNSYGQVTEVLTLDEAATRYEIVAQSDFKSEYANKVEKKVVVKGDKGGMTRPELKEALKKAGVDFKNGLTKAQLQVIYDSKVAKK